jgi:hypothetical protein
MTNEPHLADASSASGNSLPDEILIYHQLLATRQKVAPPASFALTPEQFCENCDTLVKLFPKIDYDSIRGIMVVTPQTNKHHGFAQHMGQSVIEAKIRNALGSVTNAPTVVSSACWQMNLSDSTFTTDWVFRDDRSSNPGIVIEVANAQAIAQAKEKCRKMIAESRNVVGTVILFDLGY